MDNNRGDVYYYNSFPISNEVNVIQTTLHRFSNKYKAMQILGAIVCLFAVSCSGGAENVAQPNTPTIEPAAQAISITPTPSPTASRPISTSNTTSVPTVAVPAATPTSAPASPTVAPTPIPVITTPGPTATPAAPAPAATPAVPTPTPPPVVASSGASSGSDIPFMVYGTGANPGDTIFVLVANNVIEIVAANDQGNWGPVLAAGKKGELITFLLNGGAANQSAEWEPGGTPQNVQTGFVLTLNQ